MNSTDNKFFSSLTSFKGVTASTFYNTRKEFSQSKNGNKLDPENTAYNFEFSKTSNKGFGNKKSRFNSLSQSKYTTANTSQISAAETDDTLFALNEIKNMDSKIKKDKSNQIKVWKKKEKYNIYGENANTNHQLLHYVREKVKATGDLEKFDLKGEIQKHYYFPMEYVDNIMQVEKLRKEMEKKKIEDIRSKEQEKMLEISKNFSAFRKPSLFVFSREIREICLKNILIDIMKKERDKIETKQTAIGNALEDFRISLEEDKGSFMLIKHKEEQKAKAKIEELNKAIKETKNQKEKLRQLQLDKKNYQAAIEKVLANIINSKIYCDFISRVLQKHNQFSETELKKYEFNRKKKDYEKEAEYYVKTLGFILKDDFPEVTIDESPEKIFYLYQDLEKSLLNTLEEHHDELKQVYEQQKVLNKAISDTQSKLDEKLNEYEKFELEKEELQKTDNQAKVFENGQNVQLLNELYNALTSGPKKVINCDNQVEVMQIIKDINNQIKGIENDVNDLVFRMQKIESEKEQDKLTDYFNDLITKRKDFNKDMKRREEAAIAKRIEDEKKSRYQQRQNRINIKREVHYPPPKHVLKKLEKLEKLKSQQKVNPYDELYYE